MVKKRIRVHRRDSAFVYAIFESLDGMVSYSTLSDDKTVDYRDIGLCIPDSFVDEMEQVLTGLRKRVTLVELEEQDA